jgi:hypothetical protein
MTSKILKHIRARPTELYATERCHLKPLPVWVPEPYRLHHRVADIKVYINLHCNRYSVPVEWIARRVEVRETWAEITITLDSRRQVVHRRVVDGVNRTVSKPGHRPPRGTPLKPFLQRYVSLCEAVDSRKFVGLG